MKRLGNLSYCVIGIVTIVTGATNVVVANGLQNFLKQTALAAGITGAVTCVYDRWAKSSWELDRIEEATKDMIGLVEVAQNEKRELIESELATLSKNINYIAQLYDSYNIFSYRKMACMGSVTAISAAIAQALPKSLLALSVITGAMWGEYWIDDAMATHTRNLLQKMSKIVDVTTCRPWAAPTNWLVKVFEKIIACKANFKIIRVIYQGIAGKDSTIEVIV
jgi:hypothetical protein